MLIHYNFNNTCIFYKNIYELFTNFSKIFIINKSSMFLYALICIISIFGIYNNNNNANGKQILFGYIHTELEPKLAHKESQATFIDIVGSDQMNGTIRLIRETGFLWTNWYFRSMYYINYNLIVDVDSEVDKINVSNVELYFIPQSAYFSADEWCKNYFTFPSPGLINEIENNNLINKTIHSNGEQIADKQKRMLANFLELPRRDEVNVNKMNSTTGQLMDPEMGLIGHMLVFSHKEKVLGCSPAILPTDLDYLETNLYSNYTDDDEGDLKLKQQETSAAENGNSIILLNGSHIQFVKIPQSQNLRMLMQIVYLCDENSGNNMVIHWTWNQSENGNNTQMKIHVVNLTTIISSNCSNQMRNLCNPISNSKSSSVSSICMATGIQDYESMEPLQSICLWIDQLQLPNQMGKNLTGFGSEKKMCKPLITRMVPSSSASLWEKNKGK